MTSALHDIIAEHAKGEALSQSHLDGFAAEGVPALNLAKTWSGEFSWVNRDRIVFQNEDRFEFERFCKGEVGQKAFTFVILGRHGRPLDIAAYKPPNLALWLGRAAMLGEEQALAPRLGEPLRVHPSVMSWFRAQREGIYICGYSQAAHILRNEALGVETEEHARFLRKRLTLSAPPIHVARSGVMAA